MAASGAPGCSGGTQTNLGYVPYQWTDFIFSAIGEQLGFVGCAVVLGLFALLALRMHPRRADSRATAFGRLLCAGALAFITFSVFQSVGMAIGLLPIAGIPLPFISEGGSRCWHSSRARGWSSTSSCAGRCPDDDRARGDGVPEEGGPRGRAWGPSMAHAEPAGPEVAASPLDEERGSCCGCNGALAEAAASPASSTRSPARSRGARRSRGREVDGDPRRGRRARARTRTRTTSGMSTRSPASRRGGRRGR